MNAIQRVAFPCVFLAFSVSIFAEGVEKVLNQGGKVLAEQGGKVAPIKAPVDFAGGIHINTNGGFRVGTGKVRKLENGQAISADGMLHSPNGKVAPVVDHYLVQDGRTFVVKDGGAPTPVTQNVALPDGSVLSPDATLRLGGGRIQRLLDGYTLRLDGNVIPAVDSITLKNGKVTVQKDGALIPVTSSMTMNDGTKVLANGTVTSFDGKTTTRLKEGETITVPGVVLRR